MPWRDCILTSNSAPLVITAFNREMVSPGGRTLLALKESDRWRLWQPQIPVLPEHPTNQLPNVALVGLDPADPVAQEWHLMILSPSYTAMVLSKLSAADYGVAGRQQT